jgi:Fe-S-cluster-containing hydrogenase component 2/CRP-like cAMP-binding protein
MSTEKSIARKKVRKKKGAPPTFPVIDAHELKKLILFKDLTEMEFQKLQGSVRRASAQAGETIIELPKSEESFQYFFFIALGQVYVSGLDVEAKIRPLNFLRKGDFFVDKSFQWNSQVTTKVTAITDSEIFLVPKDNLREISKNSPLFQKQILEISDRVDYRNRIYNEDTHAQSVLEFLIQTGLTQASRVKITQLDKCIACDTCYDACEERHGFQRLTRGYAKFGVLDFAKSCLTCFYPTCIPACPVDSVVFNQQKGEVEILDACIGCTSCAQACQYGAITMYKADTENPYHKRFFSPDKKVKPKFIADKCNHCEGYKDMACISNCPTDAIIEVAAADLLDSPKIFGLGKDTRDPQQILTVESPWAVRFQAFLIFTALVSSFFLMWEILTLKRWPALSMLANIQQLGFIPSDFNIELKKGSDLCVLLGNAGFALIMVAMLYPIRKALPKFFKPFGKKPRWLDFHNFCGFMGTLLVSFHTGFEFVPGNIPSMISLGGYFALVLVMMSGFLGRFLYQMIPRGVAGTELQMRDIENEDRMISEKLDVIFSYSKAQREKVQEAVKRIVGEQPDKQTFFRMTRAFLVTKGFIRKLVGELQETQKLSDGELEKLSLLLNEKVKLARNVAYLAFSYRLFKKWQFIHRPFAYVMGSLAIVHIIYNIFLFKW